MKVDSNMNMISLNNTAASATYINKSKTVAVNDKKSNNEIQQDTLEINQYNETMMPSEMYSKNLNLNKKAISIQSQEWHDFGIKMRNSITEIMTKYYNNEVSQQDIADYFDKCCQTKLELMIQNGMIEGNEEDKKNIILDMYELFQERNCTIAVNKCIEQGDKIASKFGYTGEENSDFVYYDADFYYICDELRNKLIEVTANTFEKWGINNNDINNEVEKREKNTNYVIGISFNSKWASYAKNGIERCRMIDISQAPPKDFTFFYKESRYSSILDKYGNITLNSQKGVILINGKDCSLDVDVPFNNSTNLGPVREVFNAGDLFKLYNHSIDIDSLRFISNFSVFTRTYSARHWREL